jgi:hypothetical protein
MQDIVNSFQAIPLLRRLFVRRNRPSVMTLDELGHFLGAQTAYVAQRTVLEYCRARAGVNWDKLFGEQAFLEALEVCRWDAYAQVLAEIAELALILLRRQDHADLRACLQGVDAAADAALRRHPVPAHRESWDFVAAMVARQLSQSLLAAPRAVHLMGFGAADAIFAQLPIHPHLRREDQEMFRNSVRFALCGVFDQMTRRLDAPALVQAAERSYGSDEDAGAEA